MSKFLIKNKWTYFAYTNHRPYMPEKLTTYAQRYTSVKVASTTLTYSYKVRLLSYCNNNMTTEAAIIRKLIAKLLDGEIKL